MKLTALFLLLLHCGLDASWAAATSATTTFLDQPQLAVKNSEIAATPTTTRVNDGKEENIFPSKAKNECTCHENKKKASVEALLPPSLLDLAREEGCEVRMGIKCHGPPSLHSRKPAGKDHPRLIKSEVSPVDVGEDAEDVLDHPEHSVWPAHRHRQPVVQPTKQPQQQLTDSQPKPPSYAYYETLLPPSQQALPVHPEQPTQLQQPQASPPQTRPQPMGTRQPTNTAPQPQLQPATNVQRLQPEPKTELQQPTLLPSTQLNPPSQQQPMSNVHPTPSFQQPQQPSVPQQQPPPWPSYPPPPTYDQRQQPPPVAQINQQSSLTQQPQVNSRPYPFSLVSLLNNSFPLVSRLLLDNSLSLQFSNRLP